MPKNNITSQTKKEAAYRSLINPKLMDELKERILEVVLLKKKYKEKDYNARRLAEDLGTNTRYVSAVINVRFHSNYSAFINKFRIDEAMTLLTDKRYDGMNMAEISSIVGFSNRQSFYSAFYKVTGMTPREYRLQHSTPPTASE
ncbi:MAG: AraC family transcriptional regulator [Prevotella sp.]|nr:AraC family transcriptional regulator [Prevotella sp.]